MVPAPWDPCLEFECGVVSLGWQSTGHVMECFQGPLVSFKHLEPRKCIGYLWPPVVTRRVCVDDRFLFIAYHAPVRLSLPEIPQPPGYFSPIRLQGLFSISESPPALRRNPPSYTPGPCLTLKKSRGPITLMLQISRTTYTLRRNPSSPEFSSAQSSMVSPRYTHLLACPSVRDHFIRLVCPRDHDRTIPSMYGRTV